MKFLSLPTEFKEVGESGTFSGYAAIFGNVDLGGDVIERGAFKEIVKNRAGYVRVLWQHNQRDPIGLATVEQDDKGLRFEGKLVLEDPVARRAHAHMKAGSVDGMSIGYDTLKAETLNSGVRSLKEIKLWEISPVTFGMNPLAGVDAVKAAEQITTIREFEDFLRDAGGFSKAQALQIASGGWKALQGRRDSDDAADVKAVTDYVRSLTF